MNQRNPAGFWGEKDQEIRDGNLIGGRGADIMSGEVLILQLFVLSPSLQTS